MDDLKKLKSILISFLTATVIIIGCQAAVEDLTGPSALGNTLGIQGLFGGAGIKNDGASQATVRVEVYTTQNIPPENATVTLTTTLGTLTASSLTTNASGTATTTLTSGTTRGTAYVTATVDNVSATTSVPTI